MADRTMEVRRKRKNGEVFWASLTLSILKNEAGQPVAMAGYLTDISDRKQYEEKLDYLSYFDALTSLPNRQLFLKLADQQLQTGARKQQRWRCCMWI
jgi:PleD family two-component response regulator